MNKFRNSTKAAVIYEKGSPDVFKWEEVEVPNPRKNEVRLKNTAIGVNYIDTYHRRGMPHPWPVPELPIVLGIEGVSIVEELGPDVTEFSIGDRVAYALPPHGAYSEERVYPVDKLIKIPDFLSNQTDQDLAALMLKGLTAQFLLRRTYRVKPGDVILVHAAAGGMGLLLCQWAKYLGATVIGTVSSEEKAEKARAAGAQHTVIHTKGDFVKTVLDVTDGKGCPVVYESIGKDTFKRSMDCLQPMGMLAAYGHASGAPDPVDVIELGTRGSLFLTRPAIMHYMEKRDDLMLSANDLFNVIEKGNLKSNVNHVYPLREVGEAHRAIENRETTGATVLIP
jgi:NADPH:quinone reductase-like Zn-dependent oxidoreductase